MKKNLKTIDVIYELESVIGPHLPEDRFPGESDPLTRRAILHTGDGHLTMQPSALAEIIKWALNNRSSANEFASKIKDVDE